MNKHEPPELVIAVIGPIGTDINQICREIDSSLAKSNYNREIIKVSDFIQEFPGFDNLDSSNFIKEDKRLEKLMTAGTDIRKFQHKCNLGEGDIFSRMVVAKIQHYREKNFKGKNNPAENTAFIINSLKHPAEVELLQDIYKDRFFAISAFQPKSIRIKNLAMKIANSRNISDWNKMAEVAKTLIDRDESEEGEKLGQNASKAFQLGDYFLNLDGNPAKEIDRFFDIVFGRPFVTPKIEELFMLQAKSVANMSADLSRQVGAIITNFDGEVLSQGFNEVPKAGGGTNWEAENEKDDKRDYTTHNDPNALLRDELIQEIFQVLKDNNYLCDDQNSKEASELTNECLFGTNPILKDKRIANLLEFGRVVHAEMNAISQAAKNGISIKGATMYCTTFPCHGCARHILAAGINEVVYIEPYPKSIAKQLYGRMIQTDGEDERDDDALTFRAFTGLSPNNFFKFFSKGRRKEPKGKAFDNVRQRFPIGAEFPSQLEEWKEDKAIEPLLKLFSKMKNDFKNEP